ncbi:Cupin domain-containing protein [Campylobacter blaseri]|uniref:Cupin n=1 Tax=Campylobacter blaseri TaxID=2042961 RepID=A0A2P8R0D1_9BACT|nr:cupin domain-containing protein [Campylobacter blaseri]PSM51951.1 cupin [Campylobacter blaseri]PSM53735.1 cupin [Campylobacter blaseri]QKF85709.1 Cupin domain-containing protein [Campylobacter blaseri]
MKIINWKNEDFRDVSAIKLFEHSGGKEIRISMEKDSFMKEHQAPAAIMVQVLRGKIEFFVQDEMQILDELDMVTLDSNVPHSLKALENSIIRLSLSKNDDVSRVFKVVN